MGLLKKKDKNLDIKLDANGKPIAVEGELEEQLAQFKSDRNEEIEAQQQILLKNLERFSSAIMVHNYEAVWDRLLNEK